MADIDTSAELVVIAAPNGNMVDPIVASSGNVAAGAAAASLGAVAGLRNWITGFTLTASGATTGLAVDATVTGLDGGTLTFTFDFPAGALVGATPLVVTFPQPIPASDVNTAITVNLPSGGIGNAHAASCVFGFRTAA